MDAVESVKFSEAYNLADAVWNSIVERSLEENLNNFFPVPDSQVLSRILRPHRDSALHLFLRRFFWREYIWGFEDHRSDMLDLIVSEYETILNFNDVHYTRRILPPEAADNFETIARRRIGYLRARLPVARIAQDTFQILFRDRDFLRHFGELLARVVQRHAAHSNHGTFTGLGRVSRVTLPTWLKRGVFFRDNGRCVSCSADLTSVLLNGPHTHYDHIVALAQSGSNDPTNFQILCDRCNQTKGKAICTWQRYPVFWKVAAENDAV